MRPCLHATYVYTYHLPYHYLTRISYNLQNPFNTKTAMKHCRMNMCMYVYLARNSKTTSKGFKKQMMLDHPD